MAQRRFWNWKDDDLTFDLARTFIGLIEHGLYRGYDPELGGTLSLILKHEETGAERVTKELTTPPKFGIVVTKQGVIIQEDAEIEFVINPTTTTGRKDIIVVTHNYVDIEGGVEAIYSVIEGTETAFPSLNSPASQEILGYLTLPANTTSLNGDGVLYQKAAQPNFADHVAYIAQENGFFVTSLDARGNAIVNLLDPVNDQDAATKFYVLSSIASSVVYSSEEVRGIIQLATRDEAVEGLDILKAMTPYTALASILARTADQLEANEGIVDNKFITPKTLQNRTATEERVGVAKIATEAEASEGVDDQTIITPFKLKYAMPLTPIVLELGAWNIEADASKTLPHELGDDWDKVVAMDISVRNDTNTEIVNLTTTANSFRMQETDVSVTANTSGLVLADFNSNAGNRGFVTFWVKKNLEPPLAYISVNAGADINLVVRYLKYDTPILTSLTRLNVYGAVRAAITLGAGTAGAVIELEYQRPNTQWYPLSSQADVVTGSPLLRQVAGIITDTSSVSKMYPVRAKVTLGGTIIMYTNIIVVKADGPQGFVTNGSGTVTTIYTPINLNGFVESVGVGLDSTIWSIEAEPQPNAAHITPVDTPQSVLTADVHGEYRLRLTATGTGGTPVAFDSVTVKLIPFINNVPVINAITNSAVVLDETYLGDFDVPNPSIYPYGYFTTTIGATDADGDQLRYSIIQVDSYSPVSGAIGSPVEPPTVQIVKSSIYNNKAVIRGLVSTVNATPRPYYFKVVVDDGNGGVVEKGFTVNALPVTAANQSGYQLQIPRGIVTNGVQTGLLKVTRGFATVSRLTMFVSINPFNAYPQGSMAAYMKVSHGSYPNVDADPSPIMVPIGVVTEIGSKFYNKTGVEIFALFKTERSGVNTASYTLRAYDLGNNLVATLTWTY